MPRIGAMTIRFASLSDLSVKGANRLSTDSSARNGFTAFLPEICLAPAPDAQLYLFKLVKYV